MAALALKATIGALVVIIIALLAKSKSFYIAGMVPLFPSFALIAHYIVGTERPAADLRTTAVFGLLSLIPYAVYLAAVYYLGDRLALWATLSVAAIAWFLRRAACSPSGSECTRPEDDGARARARARAPARRSFQSRCAPE